VWGAVVLLLGLVLVTSAERLRGAPMLGVLCAGLLIGRLSVEVAQARWRQLSEPEQQRLWSLERWQTALRQFGETAARLPALLIQAVQVVGGWMEERRQPKLSTKRWVRPEPAAPEVAAPEVADPGEGEVGPAAVVASFTEIDALITAAAGEPADPASEAG
jgi:hypothetical protein